MRLKTRLTEKLGIEHPILLASDDIGVCETLDIGGVYVASPKLKLRMPASNPRLNVDITALPQAA